MYNMRRYNKITKFNDTVQAPWYSSFTYNGFSAHVTCTVAPKICKKRVFVILLYSLLPYGGNIQPYMRRHNRFKWTW